MTVADLRDAAARAQRARRGRTTTTTTNAMTPRSDASPPGHAMPAPSALQKIPNERQHHADAELQRVLGHPGERRVHDHPGDQHDDQRGRRAERGQADVALRAAERHDDERDLEAFEEHALERDGERVPVVRGPLAVGAQQRDLGLRRSRPRRAAPSSRSPAGSPCAATAARRSAAPCRRRAAARRSGGAPSAGPSAATITAKRAERGGDAPPGRAPAPRDADREHDGERLDHLDRATPGTRRRPARTLCIAALVSRRDSRSVAYATAMATCSSKCYRHATPTGSPSAATSSRPAERRVAERLLELGPEATLLSAAALAEQLGTSDATVVRTAKALGLHAASPSCAARSRRYGDNPPLGERLRRTLEQAPRDELLRDRDPQPPRGARDADPQRLAAGVPRRRRDPRRRATASSGAASDRRRTSPRTGSS